MSDSPYILVSGATSHIGQKVVSELSKQYNLILHGRSLEKLLLLPDVLSIDAKYVYWVYDLTNLQTLSSDLCTFLDSNSITQIKGFVHIAGDMSVFPLKTGEYNDWLRVFNVNLFAAEEILKVLIKKKYKNVLDSIVFISSTYAHFGGRGQTAYSASKAALESFARGAAMELAPKVRVNSIVSGGISYAESEDEYFVKMKQAHPLGFGKPDDIANMVEYLLSDKSSWITGQSIVVDGGYSISNL